MQSLLLLLFFLVFGNKLLSNIATKNKEINKNKMSDESIDDSL